MDAIRLENDLVRFAFDRATGSIVEIADLVAGRQHIGDPASGRLFRVVCPSATWMSRFADSHVAGPPDFARDGSALVIRWPRLAAMDGPMEVAATVRVELPGAQTEARFTIEATNSTSNRLHEVTFPRIGGWTGLAGRGNDRAMCGISPIEPWAKEPETFSYNLMGSHRRGFHPYPFMQVPFFDISGGGAGLSYICYQERPELGGMLLENLDPEPNGYTLSFGWTSFPFLQPGGTWRSPVIGVGVHQGDWHATADRFRAWLDTWWKTQEPPERLRRSMGFQVIQLRNFDGLPNHRFADVLALAAEGMRYGVDDTCFWDPITCLYLRPDDGDFWEEYDPSQSLDDLRAAVVDARRMGANVSTMINYHLIRRNSAVYERIGGDEQVARSMYGSPVTEDWSTCSSAHAGFRTGYLSRQAVVLCQKSDAFRARALDITRRTLDLGFTSLFIDQAFETNPCFVEAHGHRSPADTHEAALEWFREAYEIVRTRDPQAYVIGETTDVFGEQHLDVAWNWSWAHVAPEVIRYTLPEKLYCWVVDHQAHVLNRAFVMGFLMAFTTCQAEQSIARYPEFAERVARLGELRKRCADWIMRGRFRDRIGLAVEGAAAYVYESPAGLAVAFADIDGAARHATLALDPAAHGRRATDPGILYRQDGSAAPAQATLSERRLRLEMDLPTLDVAVWTVPCG